MQNSNQVQERHSSRLLATPSKGNSGGSVKRIIPAKWYDKIHSMLMASIQADYEDKLKRVQKLKPSELMVSHFTDDIINSGLFRRWAIADLKKACESLSNHPDQPKIRISTETAGELRRVF